MVRPTERRAMVTSLLAAVMVTLTACGDGGPADNEPDLAGHRLPDEVKSVRYPLDTYQALGTQRSSIDMANAILIQRCLKRFGFDLPLGPPDKIITPFRRPEWYGLTSEVEERNNGYKTPVTSLEDLSFVRRIPLEARPTLTGERPGLPEGGCQGEANRAITEGSPAVDDLYLVRNLEKEVLRKAKADSRVRKIMGDWQACMKRTGHAVADPQEPHSYWNNKRAGDPNHVPTMAEKKAGFAVTADEKAMALSDVHCKKETKLLDTWVGAVIAYQDQAVERNSEQLRIHRQRLERNVLNAERLGQVGREW